MKTIHQILYFTVLILFSYCSIPSSKVSSEIVEGEEGMILVKKLEPYLQKIIRDLNYESSIAIGVTKGRNIVYAKAFGHANMEVQDTVDINTIYHMASVSKPFVATAIVQLEEKGLLKLDDPVIQYLPYFRLAEGTYDKITIKQMLTHTSGLPDVKSYNWDNPTYAENALERYVKSISDRAMIGIPGQNYAYSNLAYNCLGDLIAKVSGMPFSTYVKKNILDPVGMHESSFLKPDSLPLNWASPHVTILQPELWPNYPYNRMHAPSSTLHSSILDMCQWGIWNVYKGQLENTTILKEESYNKLIHPWYNLPWKEQIGLSWYLGQHHGHRVIKHSGADDGFRSRFIVFPELEISISVMTNQSDAPISNVLNAIINTLLDKEIAPYKIPARIVFSKELKTQGFEAAKSKWEELKQDTSDTFLINEDQLNDTGYVLLGTEQVELSKKVFQLNISEYPNSANVYDSYGDALLVEGDTLKAIDYFKKALQKDSKFGASIEKLKMLTKNDYDFK